MLLPPTLGLFVRQLGARPYVLDAQVLEPFTEDIRYETNTVDQFGLSGIANSDGLLKITLSQREGGLTFDSITSITLGLYRVQIDARTDELVKQFSVDLDLMFEGRFELNYRIQDPDDLVLGCVLETTIGNKSTWASVEVDGYQNDQSVLDYVRPKPAVDADRWLPTRVDEIRMLDDVSPNRIELNFKLSGDPKVDCTGELTYAGGGNRYLFDYAGNAVEQALNKTPWNLDCSLFVEPASRQLYSDFGLHSGDWSYIKTGILTTENYQTFDLFPQHRMLAYSVQAPNHDNATWEWETVKCACLGQTTTFSTYFETSLVSKTVKFQIGLRVYNQDTTLRHEKFIDLDNVNDFSLRQVTIPVSDIEDAGTCVGVLRVIHLYPGDRAVFVLAMPQLEYGGTASSRCWGIREQDSINYIPSSVEYSRTFGRFRIKMFLGYQGIPTTAGEQYFFDTRSSTGSNGWFLRHRHDGVLEFGFSNPDTSVVHSVESASVIQMPAQEVEVTCWYGDFGLRLDVNGNRSGRNELLLPETPDMISIVRLGRDFTELKSMSGELLEFSYEPINDAVD
jgi:hypothetical protein